MVLKAKRLGDSADFWALHGTRRKSLYWLVYFLAWRITGRICFNTHSGCLQKSAPCDCRIKVHLCLLTVGHGLVSVSRSHLHSLLTARIAGQVLFTFNSVCLSLLCLLLPLLFSHWPQQENLLCFWKLKWLDLAQQENLPILKSVVHFSCEVPLDMSLRVFTGTRAETDVHGMPHFCLAQGVSMWEVDYFQLYW